jgi:hypothetical protein
VGLPDLSQGGQFRLLLLAQDLQLSHVRVKVIGHAHHSREAKRHSRESQLHARAPVKEPVVQATSHLVREVGHIVLAEALFSVRVSRLLRVRDLDR